MMAWFIGFAGALFGFAALEIYALIKGRPTLSRTIWRIEARYPIFAFIAGIVIGGLAIHFFGWLPACNP